MGLKESIHITELQNMFEVEFNTVRFLGPRYLCAAVYFCAFKELSAVYASCG